ncbi:MAG: FIST N-terminal domain-containing protein [Myxococcales bacterium]|nr:FIST C-terminal domain-containing protein [Polyangiaceae bacterium]MDW8250592.1 FIST N-terminal domain-containing protein [Myxococcales bacterium]
MKTSIVTCLQTDHGTGDGIATVLAEKLGGTTPVLVLLFASPARDLKALLAGVQGAFPGAVVVGASTAGEFTEQGDAKGSVCALAVAGDLRVHAGVGSGLRSQREGALAQALEAIPPTVDGYPHRTALMLFDALAGYGEETVLLAAALLGEGVKIAGGAAGDDLRMKATQVALGGEVFSDAVVVAMLFTRKPLGLGVCHGHEPISPPLRVTRAEGARIFAIEGRPAWDVWRERTRAIARSRGMDVDRLEDDGVGAFLLRFEAGLAVGPSYKIRAPLQCGEDGSLLFASEIPEGALLRITESVPERQIASAREAARLARLQLGGETPAGAVVFDCICRNLILGDRFREAIVAMGEELEQKPLAGFETYGEIGMDSGEMSGFHNTTTVVLAFPE